MVDSETDYDHDGKYSGAREGRTALGEPYPQSIPDLERAFAGEIAFDSSPDSDRWRTWISSFAPMRDDAGRVDAVLGIDYDAFLWIEAIARSRLDALAVLSAVLAVILTGLVSVARLRRAAAKGTPVQTMLSSSPASVTSCARHCTSFSA